MAQTRLKSVACKQVALIIQSSKEYDKELLEGIKQFTNDRQDWSICMYDCRTDQTDLSWLLNWKGDGIIARMDNEQVADYITELNLPTIALSSASFIPEQPFVMTKDEVIAQMAADHFMRKGLRHFAVYNEKKHSRSSGLPAHFQNYVKQAGYPCHLFFPGHSEKNKLEDKVRIAEWIKALPKPIGIFTCTQGKELLEACQLTGLSVPDQVAIIGINQEDILCELLDRQLSTVVLNTASAGYHAALLLDHMMTKHKMTDHQPQEYGEYDSADALIRSDKIISDALNFIHSNACDGITVIDVLNEVPLSRRMLERRFMQILGRTPHEEIIAVRLKHVKKLLAETNLTLVSIADRTGFKHTEYLSVAFKREVGVSPSQFRKMYTAKKLTVNY